MFPYTARTIASLLNAHLRGDGDATVHRVVTDSRQQLRGDELFVGLRGPRFDGGAHAATALQRGARVVLTSFDHAPNLPAGTAQLQVDDPLQALQQLAAVHRAGFGGTVVGITGSNGKTTVKDMLATMLGPVRATCASPQSWNSQVGVALTLLRLRPDDEVALVECGISLPGEMDRLAAMVRPTHGLWVNVGPAHLGTLGSLDVTATEKSRLFRGLHTPVVTADPLATAALHRMGVACEAPTPEDEALAGRWLDATLAEVGQLRTDAALAIALARTLGCSDTAMADGLARWRPAPMRLEMTQTPRGVLIINDAYTADAVSVESALTTLAAEKRAGLAIAVLGGLAGLGERARRVHADIGARVVELGIERLVGVGEGGAAIVDGALQAGLAPAHAVKVASVEEAALWVDEVARAGDRVLLKASRPEGLERVAKIFFAGFAPTRVYVDLERVVGNFSALQRAVGPDVGVMCVVKAFGYGLDAVRMARELERAGAAYLAVAFCDEALSLRERGVQLPILVQNVLPGDGEKVLRYGLTAEVGSLEQARRLGADAEQARATIAVHLKVDTGMGRSGVLPEAFGALMHEVARWPGLHVEGLMTHLAASEDAAHDAFTHGQLDLFDAAVAQARHAGLAPRWIHAANSAAIGRFARSHYSMVRAGIGLLGYSRGSEGDATPQWPALRLMTRVVSVKWLPAGTTVGYGRRWSTADAPRRVAVVAIGYNDGYPRALSNRGVMRVGGTLCPVVGNVCMDVTMLDVTEAGEVQEGDDVVVFGPGPLDPDLHTLSEAAGTIPYELLTRLSGRVRRIYATTR